jgi:hypothetical protein
MATILTATAIRLTLIRIKIRIHIRMEPIRRMTPTGMRGITGMDPGTAGAAGRLLPVKIGREDCPGG